MSNFPRLLEILLPKGRFVMPMIEAYFDESGTHDGSPLMCVAGFIVEEVQAKMMDSAWRDMLATYKLPFFHTVDCAHHVPPFDVLSVPQCSEVQAVAIALVRSFMAFGIAVSVVQSEFDEFVPQSEIIGGPYSLCAHACLTAVKDWCRRRNYGGKVRYVFESGHKSESEANAIMHKIFAIPRLREEHRYGSHTFADKRDIPLLQAADLIAWHWFSEEKRRRERCRPKMRRDTAALFSEVPSGAVFRGMHFSPARLSACSAPVLRAMYPLSYPG